MTTDAVFEFIAVVVERNGLRALDGFSATVPKQGVTVLFGPSGSGKSTLLRLCNRLEVPTNGQVLFGGDDVIGIDPLWLRRQVGMCFQRPTPFRGTVADNLRVADPDATDDRMQDVLARVGLTGSWLQRDATALSGGEAQRMCLAHTLMAQPRVLLLDEPTSAVDAAAAMLIERAVRELADDGIPSLWVSHDAGQVKRVADRVLGIENGRCTGLRPGVPEPENGRPAP